MSTDLIAAAAVRGCRDVFLDVPADNIRARLLYRRTGFIEVGVRPNYYQPSGTEARGRSSAIQGACTSTTLRVA